MNASAHSLKLCRHCKLATSLICLPACINVCLCVGGCVYVCMCGRRFGNCWHKCADKSLQAAFTHFTLLFIAYTSYDCYCYCCRHNNNNNNWLVVVIAINSGLLCGSSSTAARQSFSCWNETHWLRRADNSEWLRGWRWVGRFGEPAVVLYIAALPMCLCCCNSCATQQLCHVCMHACWLATLSRSQATLTLAVVSVLCTGRRRCIKNVDKKVEISIAFVDSISIFISISI